MALLQPHTILIALGTFGIGLLVGVVVTQLTDTGEDDSGGSDPRKITDRDIRWAVAILVVIVWGASVLIEQSTGAQTDPLLWSVMGGMTGYLFGYGGGKGGTKNPLTGGSGKG